MIVTLTARIIIIDAVDIMKSVENDDAKAVWSFYSFVPLTVNSLTYVFAPLLLLNQTLYTDGLSLKTRATEIPASLAPAAASEPGSVIEMFS